MFANLYKKNADGSLEFVAAAPISKDGYTTLPISEAAEYILIISTETKKPGDINNDCKADLTDLISMAAKYANTPNLTRDHDFKMDYDNDGQCRLNDIVKLVTDYANHKL